MQLSTSIIGYLNKELKKKNKKLGRKKKWLVEIQETNNNPPIVTISTFYFPEPLFHLSKSLEENQSKAYLIIPHLRMNYFPQILSPSMIHNPQTLSHHLQRNPITIIRKANLFILHKVKTTKNSVNNRSITSK